MYRGLFDEKHFLLKVKDGDIDNPTTKPNGEHEANILCSDCEKRIGKFEDYARRIIYGGRLYKSESDVQFQSRKNQHGIEYIYCKGVDYNRFKLFLLSILWRSSISNLDFFKEVSLGKYQEIVRQMILEGDPGAQLDFPCVMLSYAKQKEKIPIDLICSPVKAQNQFGKGYSFLIGGINYFFHVSKSFIPDWVVEFAINEKNELQIIHMPNDITVDMIKRHLGFR
ncbi:hypothetical protein HGA64_00015 [Candidatus Falkowbacteria bacterium]|nr:hypothetical protein [Candidatus Falkowbacteria bacterium]